jgi:hypothetical protein
MRHGLKLFGVAMLAALSLMAVSAVGAQASEFWLNGTEFNKVPLNEESIDGTFGGGDLLTAGGLEIGCTDAVVDPTAGAKVIAGGTAKIALLFNGCKVLNNKFCFVYEDLKEAGVLSTLLGKEHILATADGTIIKHTDGKHYLLLQGLGKGLIFTEFDIHGELCPINQLVVIHGSTVVRLPDGLTEQPNHEVVTVEPGELGEGHLFPKDQLFLGEEKAHLKGGIKGSVHLSGPHKNENWSVK